MIWLLIAQGFGMHVALNAEELRSHFVQFKGKEKITVRRDEFTKGSMENDWAGVVNEFTEEIAKRSNPEWRTRMVPTFSTTTDREKLAFEVAYMAAMANYFQYEVMSMCGIPEVHLSGTPADWQAIIDRMDALKPLGLGWWVVRILPVLHKILESAQGSPDRGFWKSFYKFDDMSGGPYVTGWIALFFPYLESAAWKDEPDPVPEPTLWEQVKKVIGMGEPHDQEVNPRFIRNRMTGWTSQTMLELQSFPTGISLAPFNWKYLGQEFKMAFLTGFVGIRQDPGTLLLTPAIDWAVVEETS